MQFCFSKVCSDRLDLANKLKKAAQGKAPLHLSVLEKQVEALVPGESGQKVVEMLRAGDIASAADFVREFQMAHCSAQ